LKVKEGLISFCALNKAEVMVIKMDKKMKCIVCPIGCDILVNFNEKTREIVSFSGNECKRGIKFIEDEIARPVRLLTTTIKINSVEYNKLPVRSDIPIPKEKMLEMVREVKKINISVPVKAGQVIADNFMGLGIKILSCSTFNS
jgi:CxxC motif-containing protein